METCFAETTKTQSLINFTAKIRVVSYGHVSYTLVKYTKTQVWGLPEGTSLESYGTCVQRLAQMGIYHILSTFREKREVNIQLLWEGLPSGA